MYFSLSSQKAICELLGKITSFDPLIPLWMDLATFGETSSYLPPVTSAGTLIEGSFPVTSQYLMFPTIVNSFGPFIRLYTGFETLSMEYWTSGGHSGNL